MVTKIDRQEALTRFCGIVVQALSTLIVLFGALIRLSFASWRYQQGHDLRAEIARRRQTEAELQ